MKIINLAQPIASAVVDGHLPVFETVGQRCRPGDVIAIRSSWTTYAEGYEWAMKATGFQKLEDMPRAYVLGIVEVEWVLPHDTEIRSRRQLSRWLPPAQKSGRYAVRIAPVRKVNPPIRLGKLPEVPPDILNAIYPERSAAMQQLELFGE